jgi:vacuolar-type H+-ATPase subunit E/Vma4
MAQTTLKGELEREIDREVEAILARARREGETLLADARLRREKLLSESRARLEQDLAARRRRAFSRAEMEGRNALLRLRRELVDRALAEAHRQAEAMAGERPERYAELLRSLLGAARRLLPPGPLRVRLGDGEGMLPARLQAEGAVEVSIEEGWLGLVAESADGTLRCDCSLETLLARLRSEREAEIEALLFEESNGG